MSVCSLTYQIRRYRFNKLIYGYKKDDDEKNLVSVINMENTKAQWYLTFFIKH